MHVLITGTTNGIGKSIVKNLLVKKYSVIGIDKRKHNFFNNKNFVSIKLDILDQNSVYKFIKKLKKNNNVPKYFILSAGVNIYDNDENFRLENFKKCFDINFYGVMNFVQAIEKLKLKNKKILSVSSVSNIIPNPKALGYFSSKILLSKNFNLLNSSRDNYYKTIILGPVKTKISRKLKKPSGLAGMIYKTIQISAEKAAIEIVNFMTTSKKKLYLTYFAIFIYYLIKFILIFVPSLYIENKKKV